MDTLILHSSDRGHHSPPEDPETSAAIEKPSDTIVEAEGDRLQESDESLHSFLVSSSEPCGYSTTNTDLLKVTWDSTNDPDNPYNWPALRKWTVTLLTSLGGLVTLMSGTMMAPALGQISQDLHATESTTQMTLSIYVLSFAFGPMVLAPMTEVFGRKRVWLVSGCFYILWNTICGFANSNSLMIATRFLSGLGASAEFAVRLSFLN